MTSEEGLALVTGPVEQAVSVDEAKAWCRVDQSSDDTLLAALVKAACRRVQSACDGTLVLSAWRQTLDAWPCDGVIRLRRPPLASVTSIAYVDTDGVTRTLDASLYQVDAASRVGRVAPAYGESWPALRERMAAVTVAYTAGYASAAAVPEDFKTAVKVTVNWLYERRGDDELPAGLPPAAEALLCDFGSGRYA